MLKDGTLGGLRESPLPQGRELKWSFQTPAAQRRPSPLPQGRELKYLHRVRTARPGRVAPPAGA